MSPIVKYILGPTVEIGERTITMVVRIISTGSSGVGIVTVDPVGILIRDGGEQFRIALTDYISWDAIVGAIPEVSEYQDFLIKNRDERYEEGTESDQKKRTDSERPDPAEDDMVTSEGILRR